MDTASFQRDVDALLPGDYDAFRAAGPDMPAKARAAAFAAHPALRRYDEAFDRVFGEVARTRVVRRPAVWLLYNMGVVVKTPQTVFAIDLVHRRAARFAPVLDFALVTHNHADHADVPLLDAMDAAGKTVVSDFRDNYAAVRAGRTGGYTRRRKVFRLGDAVVRTGRSDHNKYLVDFTTTFEISAGDWTLYHTGDSSKLAKLNPKREPDLWIVHPRCGLDATEAAAKFHPRRTVVAHLCELSHPPDKWRWTIPDGQADAARLEAAGFEAVVPLWGERLQ
jgi:L-ascorbate metabolism protein UlaG (beta-lactamase superfamily)